MAIKKILIANRSEVAVRIIAACRTLNIKTVAVYTQEDRMANHVYHADAAYPLSLSGSAGYLNSKELISLAHAAEVDAIHPGYGFLAESASFAQEVISAGLTWIGPSPNLIAQMGNKIAAREIMTQYGVPTIPGFHFTHATLNELSAAKTAAASLGYPVILKSANGGGGKAMRSVYDSDAFDRAWEQVLSESQKYFQAQDIFIEKYIESGRHIEIQVAGDGTHACHFFERECSIQRRHQKIIEETPCAFVSEKTLAHMYEISLHATKTLGYDSIGTLEFLVTPDESFYFLEMNTRLQVEHGITEMTCGIDLVQLQITLAQTKQLPLTQEKITRRGHAIECRITTEDDSFTPSCGAVTNLMLPQGPFVRHDHALETGMVISPFFDAMLSKLIAFGSDRQAAIANMQQALSTFTIKGVATNIALHQKILASLPFQHGTFHTRWLEPWTQTMALNDSKVIDKPLNNSPTAAEIALIAALLMDDIQDKTGVNSPHDISKTRRWKEIEWQS